FFLASFYVAEVCRLIEVPERGLEPLWISPPDPKSGASANSATLATGFSILCLRFCDCKERRSQSASNALACVYAVGVFPAGAGEGCAVAAAFAAAAFAAASAAAFFFASAAAAASARFLSTATASTG